MSPCALANTGIAIARSASSDSGKDLDAFLTAIRIDPIARVIEPFLGARCFKLAFFDHKLVSQVRDHAAAGVAKPSSLPVYTGLRQPKDGTKRVMVFFRSPRHELDPL